MAQRCYSRDEHLSSKLKALSSKPQYFPRPQKKHIEGTRDIHPYLSLCLLTLRVWWLNLPFLPHQDTERQGFQQSLNFKVEILKFLQKVFR
jgi:hypothetical protein